MIIASCIVLSVLTAWYVFSPYFYEENEGQSLQVDESRIGLGDQKDRRINMLRDLELDYSTGKVDLEDYENMKSQISYELGTIIEKLDRKKP